MNPLQVGGTLFESPMSFKKSPSGIELENISFGFIEKILILFGICVRLK